MRLFHKLAIAVLIPILLIWGVAFYATKASNRSLRDVIEAASEAEAYAIIDEIDRILHMRVSTWRAYIRSDIVQQMLQDSNGTFDDTNDPEGLIDQRDADWIAAAPTTRTDTMDNLMSNRLSRDLRLLRNKLAEFSDYPVFGEIFLTNKYGANVSLTGITTDYRQNDEMWWQEAWKHGIFIGDIEFDDSSEMHAIDLCIRVDDADGKPQGVLKAVLNIHGVVSVVKERRQPLEQEIALFTSDNRIICSTGNQKLLEDGSRYFAGIGTISFNPVTVWRKGFDSDKQMLYSFAPSRGYADFDGLGWKVVVSQDAEVVQEPLVSLSRHIAYMAFAATLLALMLSGGVAMLLTARLEKVSDATYEVSRGNLKTRIAVTGSDEIAELAQNFNSMTNDLESYVEQQKQTTRELERARDDAQAASHAKSDFLANMSHEIRTPMNAVIGMTEYVLETDLDQKQREFLSIVLESSESLLLIINEILDFSKIEAGKLELASDSFSIRNALGDSIKSMGMRAYEKGIDLAFQISNDIPERLIGDSTRLKQIIINLVGNAIKFTDQGGVLLKLELVSHNENVYQIRHSVIDTGIGIPKNQQQAIFESFRQEDGSITRRYGGTGLGLAICSQLASLMGADIDVQSEPGQGSTFSFTLDLEAVEFEHDEPTINKLQTVAGSTIMIVDENPLHLSITREMLQGWSAETIVAVTGVEAIAHSKAAIERGKPIDLIILDFNVSQMADETFLQQMREIKDLADTRVIALTTGERTGDLQWKQIINVSAFLMKPVTHAEMLDAIHESLSDTIKDPFTKNIVRQDELPPIPKLKVLLAEDGAANRILALSLLKKWGHTIEVATNGKEAVEAFKLQKFDLVLMDIQMPELDGLQATLLIREHEQETGTHVPIVAVTARAIEGDREKCIESQMDAYISKPIRQKEFYQVIAPLFVNAVQSDMPRFTERDPGDDGEPVAIKTEEPKMNIIEDPDLEVATEMIGGDAGILSQIVEAFLEEVPQLTAKAHQSLQERDSEQFSKAVHSLKSTLRVFGVPNSVELAENLEQSSRGGDLALADQHFDHLSKQIEHMIEQLNRFMETEQDR